MPLSINLHQCQRNGLNVEHLLQLTIATSAICMNEIGCNEYSIVETFVNNLIHSSGTMLACQIYDSSSNPLFGILIRVRAN